MPSRIEGVKGIFLIKGSQYNVKDDTGQKTSRWVTYSPLIRGYRKLDGSEFEYKHSWQYKDSNNRLHTLGKGWSSFNVWEEMKVKDWIRLIASGQVQPEYDGDILGEQFWLPQVILRRKVEQESWLRETIAQENTINTFYKSFPRLLKLLEEYYCDVIDTLFPKYRHSCDYPTHCDFYPLCWEGKGDNPLENGYTWRIPHHLADFDRHNQLYHINEIPIVKDETKNVDNSIPNKEDDFEIGDLES